MVILNLLVACANAAAAGVYLDRYLHEGHWVNLSAVAVCVVLALVTTTSALLRSVSTFPAWRR